jgi:drug/metabolite transporter (DMT)-like permease
VFTSWYIFALGALVFMGIQRFLYKVSAERNCNTAWTTFAFMGTVAILSGVFFFLTGAEEPQFGLLLLYSSVNSLSFLLSTMTHMEALKIIPAGIVYPIVRLNVVPVVIFSVLYFKDRLSGFQSAGIAMAIVVMLVLTREAKGGESPHRNTRRGVLLAILSLLGGAVASISSKFAAISNDPLAYMALSYLLSTLFSFGLRGGLEGQGVGRDLKAPLRIGLAMGFSNFAGYYLFLRALALGPLSIVISLTGMHFVIPILLSVVIYGERLGPLRILAVSMTVVSILLMRF